MYYSSYLIIEYVTKLLEAVEDCVKEALPEADAQLQMISVPGSLTSDYTPVDKDVLIALHSSRFNH